MSTREGFYLNSVSVRRLDEVKSLPQSKQHGHSQSGSRSSLQCHTLNCLVQPPSLQPDTISGVHTGELSKNMVILNLQFVPGHIRAILGTGLLAVGWIHLTGVHLNQKLP